MQFMEQTITAEKSGYRLDKLLAKLLPGQTKGNLQRLLRKKFIKVNHHAQEGEYRVQEGEVLSIPEFLVEQESTAEPIAKRPPKRLPESQIKAMLERIIYRDENILVLNKPYDLAVQGGSGIYTSVTDYLPHMQFDASEPPKVIHRLDRYTSGLLLLARNYAAVQELGRRFREHDGIQKIYLALTLNVPPQMQGSVRLAIKKGKLDNDKSRMLVDEDQSHEPAITNYMVKQQFLHIPTVSNTDVHRQVDVALVQLEILTGKMHQIRIHLKSLGCPIISDGKYGGRDVFINKLSNKLHLFASELTLNNFFGKDLHLEAPMPDFFQNSLNMLMKLQK